MYGGKSGEFVCGSWDRARAEVVACGTDGT